MEGTHRRWGVGRLCSPGHTSTTWFPGTMRSMVPHLSPELGLLWQVWRRGWCQTKGANESARSER